MVISSKRGSGVEREGCEESECRRERDARKNLSPISIGYHVYLPLFAGTPHLGRQRYDTATWKRTTSVSKRSPTSCDVLVKTL